MSVTIKEIAALSGISRGTVDRVLHNRPGVRPEIAEQVRKIAKELGYQPNKAGRVLALSKNSITVGCFLPSIGNPFFDDVVKGFRDAEKEYSDFGFRVELSMVKGYDVQEHIEAIKALVDAGCKALCISSVDVPQVRELIDTIIRRGIPVVTVNTDLNNTKRLCYFGSDYYEAGCTSAGVLSLMTAGPLEMMIITGSKSIKGHNDRIAGFTSTLRTKSIPYHLNALEECLDSDEKAYELTLGILKSNPQINCIFVAAAGVEGTLRAVKELGFKKPGVRILTFDDIPATRQMVTDGLIECTVCQEPYVQGYQAMKQVCDMIVGGVTPQGWQTRNIIKIAQNL